MTEAAMREFDTFYARARGRLAIKLAALTGDPVASDGRGGRSCATA